MAIQAQVIPLIQRGNLLMATRHGSACDFHRITLPYQRLLNCTPKVPVLVFNRWPTLGIQGLLELKSIGYRIIVDMDDHFVLDNDHYLKANYGQIASVIQQCLKIADRVTVTTEILADELKPHCNNNIVVIPNALPFDEGQFTKSTDLDSGSPIVYTGGASHLFDLDIIQKIYGSHMTIAGFQEGNSEWAKIKARHITSKFAPYKPLDSYMSLYDGHKIALAPLRDTTFNACKSNLKVLEAGAKGLPVIASPVKPYLNDIDKDVVLYASDRAEWQKIGAKLLNDAPYRIEMAARLADHVRVNYSLTKVNEMRRQLLESFS